jgi:hypothetical protein
MTDELDKITYTEFEPDYEAQQVIDDYVSGSPWLLIHASSAGVDGLTLSLEAGGGLTVELIEPMLKKALLAIQKSQEQA